MSDHEPAISGNERPDTDDYDLLTYGEVAARINESLKQEQDHLDELERSGADLEETATLRQRIADLTAGRARYQEHSATSATFMRRFGLTPRQPD